MSNEKQTSGWEERLEKLLADYRKLCEDEDCVDMAQGMIEAFIAAERKAVAKAMAEAVVPKAMKNTWSVPAEKHLTEGYNACRAEVSRRAEEFIAKL